MRLQFDFRMVACCMLLAIYGWEVAARLSHIDLNSQDVKGGRLTDFTFGLNWYLNNYSKMQFNYVRAFLDSPTQGNSAADIFGLRAQLDF